MANNINNGITGVIDIPGALRSRGAADGNQVGGVVAYAGDIYDTTAGKNQASINEEFDAKLQQTDQCIDISNYIRIQGGAYEWIQISGNYQDGYYITEEDQNKGSALASLLSDCDLLDTTTLEKVAKIRYANYISNTEKIEFSLDTDLGELDGDSFCIENINAVQNTWSFGIGYFGNNAMYSNLVGFRNYNTGSISALFGYNNLNTKSRSSIVGSNNVNAKQNSVVLGDSNTNDGTYSNIIGNKNTNSASAGSVLGYQNSVSADSSLAYTSVIGGLNTVNSGGVILGIQNTTDCVGSTYILGRQNTVNVPNTGVDTTVLLGQHLSVTNSGGGLYIGRYNKEYAGPSLNEMNYFAIGGGSSDQSRQNLLEIKRNGEVFISDIGGFDGTNSTVTGIKSLQGVLSDIEKNSSSSSSAPTYSAGTGITISNNTISVNTSSLNYNDLSNIPLQKTAENGFKIVAHNSNSYNTASGQNAFAEGNGTYAAGVASHSEGSDTYAAAANSHVEGNGKVVIMLKQAYTQGDLTIVTDVPYPADTELESPRTQERVSVLSVQESQGVYICTLTQAFSEDIATNQPLNVYGGAIGVNSHAEGCGTIAAHDSTHAEGYGTIANGIYAKASGEKSYALGRASETTGRGTQALNEAEHASGRYNKSTSNVTQFSVGIGSDAEHRANAYEVTTDGKMYVKGVGGYDGTNVSDSSVDDLATAISQAGGVTQKEGERGYVLGNSSSATGLNSFAQGNGTYAIGNCSHAEGAAECVNNSLSSDYTAGSQTMNLKYIAYVGNIIIVDNQIAKILSVTKNSFDYTIYLDKPFASDISESTTIKIYPCAYGNYSHTEGFNSMASGESSHAEGYNTKAQGTASHAEGSGTKALGLESHAEGYDTYADGNYSHAEGADTQASGTYSHAEGSSSRATGASSHAEGANTYASGTRSHAEGYYSQAFGDCTHAEGFHTLARNTGEHACGTYNKSTQDVTLFSIGNGYTGQQGAPDTHQNAFEVDVNGNVYINNIGNYNGRNIGQSGVDSVQQVIEKLTQQIAALTNNQ